MSASSGPGGDPALDRSDLWRDLGLVLWQVRYEQRAYWRNRQRGVFTFVFPLMFLVIFGSIFHGKSIYVGHGQHYSYDTFFVPGILAYGVVTTTYVNIAIGTSILRDAGVLKRMQGTPLPRWAYVAARVGSTIVIVVIMTVLTLGFGAIAYGVSVRGSTLPAVLLYLVLGTWACTTLGIGITRFIKNAESAPIVVNLTLLPLTFISGIWFTSSIPKALHRIAEIFPLEPLAHGMQHAFIPIYKGSGFNGQDIRTLLIWAVLGSLLMLSTLRKPEGDWTR